MSTSKRRPNPTYKTRRTTLTLVVISGLVGLILVGGMSLRVLRSRETTEAPASVVSPPAPQAPAPALAKEYIYAGNKLVATEEPVANVAPTVSITSPVNNAVFLAPATITINANANDTDGTVSKVEFFQGETLVNTDTAAPYSFTLNNVLPGSHALKAKATDNNNAETTSATITVISNSAPTVGITAPVNNTVFTAPANITINANASDSDGTVSKVEFFEGNNLLNTDTSSPYSFAWNNVSAGVYSLTAKVTDNHNAVITSAPITVISNALPSVSITAPVNNAVFNSPANITISANATDSDGTISKVEFFQGSTLLNTDTSAPFSFAWNNVSAGTYSLTAKATDNNNGVKTSGPITVISNALPTVSITSPANNATFTAPANITINASASDSDGTITKVEFFQGSTLLNTDTSAPFSFAWNSVPASGYQLTARATDNNNGVQTSSPINITVGANALPTVSITAPANNAVFDAPASITINATASDSDGTITKVEFFQGSTLLNTDTSAPFSFAWNNVPAGSYLLTAKATDNNNGEATSSQITVISNALPTVSITAPANNTVFTAPANITINANASDSDGTITKVEFFQGATLLNTDTAAPFSFAWNNVPAGTYTLTAKATDNRNAVQTSSPITVISNALPSVSITSPANNTVFAAPANITIDASASDSDGTITKVEFFQGTTLLNTDTSAPFSFAWTNVPAGTYSLTAKATDNNNGVQTSGPITVIANVAPAVSITSPANNAIFSPPPANITINATASDSDGTISVVEFYQGATLIGSDNAAPYTVTWNNVVAGAYQLTAKATDNRGTITTSSLVAVTVPTFYDDFNDNSLDLSKWHIRDPNSPHIVSEQSQQLRITLAPSTASYNGVGSNATYDMRGGIAQVEMVQPVSLAGWTENYLILELDAQNHYLMQVGVGNMIMRARVNGVNDDTLISYSHITHRFWRIRHNVNTGTVSFETSPEGAVWTSRKTVAAGFSVTALRFVMLAGSWGTGNASPGAAIYNDFQYIPDPNLQGTPPPIFSDDFNDNSINTAKWNTDNLFSGFTSLSVPITETNQRLEIGNLLQNTGGSNYRGVRSVNTYNFTNSYAYVDLVQAASSATDGDAMFTIGINVDNYYRIYVSGGDLIGQKKIAGTKTTLFNIPYDSTNHRFLRIRHDSGNMLLDTAPNNNGAPGAWTQRYTEMWNAAVTLTAVIFELKGGTWQSEGNAPGKVIFDNFAHGSNTAPPPNAPTVTSISPNNGLTSGGTSVTISGSNFLAGAVVSIGGTAATNVNVTNSSTITATTPAHSAGVVNVVVTNTDNQSGTLTNGYTYNEPPPQETVLLADDFNDNSIDSAKWNDNLFSGFTSTSVPISETNLRLEIGNLLQSTGGSNYRGVRSVNTYNFTSGYTYVELVQTPSSSTAGDAMFTIGLNVDNYYRIYVSNGNLIGQKKIGGTKTQLFSIPYDSTNHRFLRIRHVGGSMTLETAPGNSGAPGAWTQRYSEIWNNAVTLTSITFELKGGTWQSESNAPGKAIFDNFRAAVPNP